MIITIANQKGGVGKTTITTNLACVSINKDHRTLIVDTDPQQSSMQFRQNRSLNKLSPPQIKAVHIPTPTLHEDVKDIALEHTFIDVGGHVDIIFKSAFLASDVVIIPLEPSEYDIASTVDMMDIVRDARMSKDIKVGIVFNRLHHSASLTDSIKEKLQELVLNNNLYVFKNHLFDRKAYKKSASEGLGVTEITTRDYEKAAEDFTAFYLEVVEWAKI